MVPSIRPLDWSQTYGLLDSTEGSQGDRMAPSNCQPGAWNKGHAFRGPAVKEIKIIKRQGNRTEIPTVHWESFFLISKVICLKLHE